MKTTYHLKQIKLLRSQKLQLYWKTLVRERVFPNGIDRSVFMHVQKEQSLRNVTPMIRYQSADSFYGEHLGKSRSVVKLDIIQITLDKASVHLLYPLLFTRESQYNPSGSYRIKAKNLNEMIKLAMTL